MSLATAVEAVATALETVAGLAEVHHMPPEGFSEFPAAIVYAKNGEMGISEAGGKVHCDNHTHTIVVEVHQAGKPTPDALTDAHAWPDSVYTALKAATLSGNMRFVFPLIWELGSLDYNRETHIGVYFEVTVKE